MQLMDNIILLAVAAIVILSIRTSSVTLSEASVQQKMPKREASALVGKLAARKRRSLPTKIESVCVFDFDDTLVDTSHVSGQYRGLPLYAGIPHMIDLVRQLQTHSRIVILTARADGAAPLVMRNCEHVGLRLNARDFVATCPAVKKAAWRANYCAEPGRACLVVAGDLHTDVNGPPGAIALRVLSRDAEDDLVCDDCDRLPVSR